MVVAGYRLLDAGCWMLDGGWWLRIISQSIFYLNQDFQDFFLSPYKLIQGCTG